MGGVVLIFIVLFIYAFRLVRQERAFSDRRTRFVATASHELRTPISVIQLHAESLVLGRVSGEKRAHYERSIMSEARRAGALVENFLTLSRQGVGEAATSCDLEDLDLVPLVFQVMEPFGQRVSLSPSSASKLEVRCHRHALTQILFNLVDNAMKYSDDPVVVIISSDEKGNRVEICDTGIGIEEQDFAKVFEEFYRSRDQRVSAQRGSGIGLTISRRLAREMNCELVLAANQPQGTRASLIFPRI